MRNATICARDVLYQKPDTLFVLTTRPSDLNKRNLTRMHSDGTTDFDSDLATLLDLVYRITKERNDPMRAMVLRVGDSSSVEGIGRNFVLSKATDRFAADQTVLIPVQMERHFGQVPRVLAFEQSSGLQFYDKRNNCVFRGVSTGNRVNVIRRIYSLNRLPDEHRDVVGVDVALTKLLQGHENDPGLRKFLRKPISIEDQLQNKYLLVLEGNDVATMIKWALASNSVVLMSPPTKQTVGGEFSLRPFQHYVPLPPTITAEALDRALQWCHCHQNQCALIAQAATRFARERLVDREQLMNEGALRMVEYAENTAVVLRGPSTSATVAACENVKWRPF